MSTIANNKLDLIRTIMESDDSTFISKVAEYVRSLKKTKAADWADDLPEHVEKSILLGIDQIEKGDVIPHEEILAKYRSQFPHLKL